MYEVSRVGKFIETENRLEVKRGLRRGRNRQLLFNRYRIFVRDDEKVLEIDNGDSYTILWM